MPGTVISATIEQLSEVEWASPNHFYRPLLDVDLSVESVRNPEAFLPVSTVVGI